MAEEAAIFGGVGGGQRRDACRGMAFMAEFFRLLFLHGQKALVIVIMGDFGCGFFRRLEEKEKQRSTEKKKGDIESHCVPFFPGRGWHNQGVVVLKG